jgi:hypothetical protein
MRRKIPGFYAIVISMVAVTRLAADCPSSVTVIVPATACKSGTATARAIGAIPGASYAWTVTGGQIFGDASGDGVSMTLGTSATATVSVTMTAGDCVSKGSSTIPLQDPFGVRFTQISEAHAAEPVSVVWAYENGSPSQQTLSTGDSAPVSLAPDVRYYAYTPQTSGSRQFVIDATLKQAIPAKPPAPKQRAVAKSPASASSCTVAHAVIPYTVSTCISPTVVLEAPDSVTSSTSFSMFVRSQAGAVATWTITNGSPATATGYNITVMPGASGNVGIAVSLTRGACTSALERSIPIVAKPVCDSPTASVSLGPLSCGSGSVNATFTGTPPFQGVWSDGEHFFSNETSLVRRVQIPGDYRITTFKDAVCDGTQTGVAVVPPLVPTAQVWVTGNGCALVDSAYVNFTGKAPFSACWNDGTCFTTFSSQIVKPLTTVTPMLTLASGNDRDGCPLAITGGARVLPSPKAKIERKCVTVGAFEGYNMTEFFVTIDGTFIEQAYPTWSDGSHDLFRYFMIDQTTTYTLNSLSVYGSQCAPVIDPPRSVTVYPTPVPAVTPSAGDVCAGSTFSAAVTPPPPGTQVTWEMYNGTILSGQGTNAVQVQGVAGPYGTVMGYLYCTFTFSDPTHCPLASRTQVRVVTDPYATLSLDSTPLHSGKTNYISFSLGYTVTGWSLENSMGDPITLIGKCDITSGGSSTCTATYTSTHGPGQSTVTLHAKSACPTKDVSGVVTIVP